MASLAHFPMTAGFVFSSSLYLFPARPIVSLLSVKFILILQLSPLLFLCWNSPTYDAYNHGFNLWLKISLLHWWHQELLPDCCLGFASKYSGNSVQCWKTNLELCSLTLWSISPSFKTSVPRQHSLALCFKSPFLLLYFSPQYLAPTSQDVRVILVVKN